MRTIIYTYNFFYTYIPLSRRLHNPAWVDDAVVTVDATAFIERSGVEKLTDNLARRWGWHIPDLMGGADGPCTFVTFK